jgi:hypothetical protein
VISCLGIFGEYCLNTWVGISSAVGFLDNFEGKFYKYLNTSLKLMVVGVQRIFNQYFPTHVFKQYSPNMPKQEITPYCSFLNYVRRRPRKFITCV